MKSGYVLIMFGMILLAGCSTNTNKDANATIVANYQNAEDNTLHEVKQNNTINYITQSNVNYFEDTYGYFVTPNKVGEYPGLILIHEWWGLNTNIKETADKIAEQGFNVLAVDLYHGKVATNQTEAMSLVGLLNQTEAINNMNAAFAYLQSHNSTRIGSWGWCFGGGQSMQLALNNHNLNATVIYYGNLETNATNLKDITWPVMGVFGDKDTSIPVAKVEQFKDAINIIGIPNEVYIYPNVGHAFANPTGTNYAPNETADSWNKTMIFLNKYLKE